MGRRKKLTRDAILDKAIPLFWEHGFADTALQELERVTGANKSALYTEFKSKQGLFVASLRRYLEGRPGGAILMAEPAGWNNVESFLKTALLCPQGQRGCLATNSMREAAILSAEANTVIAESKAALKRQLTRNIGAESTRMDPTALAELVSMFFSGLCLEQNLITETREASLRKIDELMTALRAL